MNVGLLSSILLLGIFASNAECSCHVTIVAPNQLRINTRESIHLNFHGCSETVNAEVNILSLPDSLNNPFSGNFQPRGDEPLKIEFEISKDELESTRDNEGYVKLTELTVRYCSEPVLSCNSRKTEKLVFNVNFTHGYAFMTTDRPAYRPSEEVKVVVIATKQNLVLTEESREVTMRIRIPHEYDNIIVKESVEKFDIEGMLEYTYGITEDPMKGVWWAEAVVDGEVMASTSFVIDKYVSTTYHVKIFPEQPFILPTQRTIRGSIIAKYSYGEVVDGVYYISMRLVRPDNKTDEFYKIPSSFSKIARFVAGRQDFEVDTGNLRNHLSEGETMQSLLDGSKVQILATVTTEGGSAEVVTDLYELVFTKSPYVIDYSQSSRFYVTNTIYQVQATVKDSVMGQPVGDVPVNIKWNGGEVISSSESDGNIYYEIDSFVEAEEYTITFSTADENIGELDQYSESFTVKKYQSDKQLTLSVNQKGRNFKVLSVGTEYFLKMNLGQSAPSDIRIYMISRGEIVKSLTETRGRQGEVSVPFTVTAEMVPEFRILAYYVLNGEVTANSAWYDVEDQCKSELTITTDRAKAAPDEDVLISIEGPASSKVYLSAVDRAAYFIHNETRLTRDSLWAKMKAYDTACSIQGGKNAASVFRQAGMVIQSELIQEDVSQEVGCGTEDDERKKRSAPNAVEAELSRMIEKCAESGRAPYPFTITCGERAEFINMAGPYDNMDLCLESFMTECQLVTRSRRKANLARSALVQRKQLQRLQRARQDFSASWFFKPGKIDEEGKLEKLEHTRDSITIFDVQAFGWGREAPFCVAKPKEVKVFQNLFLQLFLPYSVRVKEQATIRFALFNYGDRLLTADIHIKHTDALCSNFKFGEFRHLTTLTIDPFSSASSYFTILPMKIPMGGTTTISLKAATGNAENEDWIQKELLIEEPGQHNESYGSFQLEPDTAPINFRFDIAKSSVNLASRKCFIYLYAHPMGPSVEVDAFDGRLSNLDQYISIPTGCGEQNMIRIGPTVYIHKYRLATLHNRVTPAQTAQVIEHIQKAYQIELGWRSDPQKIAFAVWNYAPPSTWLNAFVTKVFAQARHFWKAMQLEPICKAVDWMLTQQDEITGHFKENYRVYHNEMRGFVVDDITRTAYVSISLSEVQETCPKYRGRMQESRRKALNYVAGKLNDASNTPYALAMGAYALAIDNPLGIAARDWNQRLRGRKIVEGEFTFWRGTRGRAANIETTAYALLAELAIHEITQENNLLTRSIARWLISNRNDKGGFISTQDTVVALQALSTYMTKLENTEFGPPPTDLQVTISSSSEDSPWNSEPVHLNLSVEDAMKRKTIEVPTNAIDEVTATVTGIGMGSMSYRCTWRQYAEDGDCHFDVDVNLYNDEEEEGSKKLTVMVAKVLGEPAQMSIIDISILSGFVPDIESVQRLSKEEFVDGQVDRFENANNTLKLYLSNIDNSTRKIGFTLKEVAKVNNRQPASVTVYDYQEPGIRCTKFYSDTDRSSFRTSCSGNEKTCKCAEGDCLRCRTRREQLRNTTCSSYDIHRRRCKDLCSDLDHKNEFCLNLHSTTCLSDYAYMVQVMDVSVSPVQGFKRVIAFVEDTFRISGAHRSANNTNVTFHIRNDCYKKCQDERFTEIAKKKKNQEEIRYIDVGRRLLVYGKAPNVDRNKNPPEIIYDLDADAGLEIFLPPDKCDPEKLAIDECAPRDKKCKKKNKKTHERKKLCKLLRLLKEAHVMGCDI